jgi:uncharacterized protein YfcZ (UPF0381/DUF406 family)
MSVKKATPKAVFDACEQLELLDRPWNRDDVRLNIGGGSFSVIDPLIQAWRKLQPIRQVAPSVPTDLLIQVATMLELQISDYVSEVALRDQERETALLALNETVSDNLQRVESELTEQLALSQQANHDLEAECSRVEYELKEKAQSLLAVEFKFQVSEEAAVTLSQRLKEQQAFYESGLQVQKQSQQDERARTLELHQQQINQMKIEAQQQLIQQKVELIDAAQLSENRLMRLLDQGRNELKEFQLSYGDKLDALTREQQADKQLSNKQMHDIKSLEISLQQTQLEATQLTAQYETQLTLLNNDKLSLQQQLIEQAAEKGGLESLASSIKQIQDQITKDQITKDQAPKI